MSKPIIGVMGPGSNATPKNIKAATKLGRLIAKEEWVLLTGGRDVGVMGAVSKGAQKTGGVVIGILPSSDKAGASEHLDIPICTGMGSARNNINVLSSDIVIAIGSGAGTTSEIMLALKSQTPLVLLNPMPSLVDFIDQLPYSQPKSITSPKEAIPLIKQFL